MAVPKEAAEGFMNGPGYAPHLMARTAGAVSHHCLIRPVSSPQGAAHLHEHDDDA
jgi:hypothetical protein